MAKSLLHGRLHPSARASVERIVADLEAAAWAVETLPKLRKVIAAMRAHAEDAAWHPSYRNALAKFLPDLAALLPKEE